MASKKFPIYVTHYINPHLFYFKIDLGTSDENEKLDNELQDYVKGKLQFFPSGHEPEVGEIVVVFFHPLSKWIRARVDYVADLVAKPTRYVLWSPENGTPFSLTSKWILPLRGELASRKTNTVYLGGLANCLPINREFNYDIMRMQKVVCKEWSEAAVKNIANYLETAAEVYFVPVIRDGDHRFGQILVKTNVGESVDLASEIMGVCQAMLSDSDNFLAELYRLNTTQKKRWQMNDGTLNMVKLSSNSSATAKMVQENRSNENPDLKSKIDDWRMKNMAECKKYSEENVKSFENVMSLQCEPHPQTKSFMKTAGLSFRRRDADFAEFNLRKPSQHTLKSIRSSQAEMFSSHFSIMNTTIDEKSDVESNIGFAEPIKKAEQSKKLPAFLRSQLQISENKQLVENSTDKTRFLPSGYVL